MLPNNIIFKRSSRCISFFGRKKPATTQEGDCTFDMKSCFDQKASSLKVRESCSLEGCCSLPKVIVVGAGLAGMSAASKLIQAGVKDLLVLEATSRPGGRIMSSWVGDAMIEFGPTVLYGASLANPVYNLANLSGAITYPVRRLGQRKRLFLTSDGELITDYAVETLLYNQLISDAKSMASRTGPGSCASTPKRNLMQYLGLRIQQELLDLPSDMQKKSEKILWGMLNSLRVAFGAELSQISSWALSDRGSSPGGPIILEGGMHRILSPLLQKLPEDKILLNTPVHKITLDPCPEYHKPVKVITCDNKVFEADYVVVTVPLGVLKKRADEMFEGALSKEQSNAIKNIGLGQLNHVYLEYAHPWWIPGMPSMSLAWGMEELQLSTEWTKGIGYIHEVHGSKHLLSVDIAGPEAELIEGVAEEEVAIQITRFLRKFTGDTLSLTQLI
uniref:Peroxisomal N(1)-acetyl-spermine/spermidine oxidase n=1 Tax=Lygus hesperus TaxID=30085 RepID=A0A0A9W4Y9_LYGHE